jgi:anti-sigma factor RsiW
MISCRECTDALPEYALGNADEPAAHAVAEHVAACPVCRRELASIERAWSALPALLPRRQPPERVFAEVLARIDRQQAAAGTSADGSRLAFGRRVASYLLAASVLTALTAGLFYLSRPDGDDAAARASVERLAERLGKLQEMERQLATANVRLVSLHGPQEQASAEAFLVWDLASRQWHFYASGLPQAPAGRQYQLWAQKRSSELLAGPVFDIDQNGLGSVVVDLPALDPQQAAKVIVTLEPRGGSKSPSGEVVLEASL